MIINVWMCPPGSLLRIHVGAGPHAETDVQVAPGLHGWPVACHAANLRAYRDRDPPTCCFARHRGAVQCRGSLLSGSLPSRLLLHVHLSPSISTFLHPLPLPPARLLLELAQPLMLRMRRDKDKTNSGARIIEILYILNTMTY